MKTEIFWIYGFPAGRLGISPRPRGGDWLDDEIQSWRDAGTDCVVSLLTRGEEADLGLQGESSACREHGVEFISLAIPDRGVPQTVSLLDRLLSRLVSELDSGRSIVIHCRQGIGRASLIAALAMITLGEDTDRAFSRIEQARGRPVPDTEEQREWVRQFARRHHVTQQEPEHRQLKAAPSLAG